MFTAEHFKTWVAMLLGIAVAAVPLLGNISTIPSSKASMVVAPLALSPENSLPPEL